jgi:hypothetical protein
VKDFEAAEVLKEIDQLFPDHGYSDAEIKLYRWELMLHDRDKAIDLVRNARLTTKFAKPDLPGIFSSLRGDTAGRRHEAREIARKKTSTPTIESLRNSYQKLYGPSHLKYGDVAFLLRHGRGLFRQHPSQKAHIEKEVARLLYRELGVDEMTATSCATICCTSDQVSFDSESVEWENHIAGDAREEIPAL